MDWNRLRSFLPVFLLLGGFGSCVAWVLSPIFENERQYARISYCQVNLKNIAMASLMYAENNDSQFPPLSLNGKGWGEIIYRNSNQTPDLSCSEGEKSEAVSSDYFYNARLKEIGTSKIKDPMKTIAFGDGMDNGPTNSHLLELPTHMIGGYGFSARHRGGANYSFADGHVRWLLPKHLKEGYWLEPAEK